MDVPSYVVSALLPDDILHKTESRQNRRHHSRNFPPIPTPTGGLGSPFWRHLERHGARETSGLGSQYSAVETT